MISRPFSHIHTSGILRDHGENTLAYQVVIDHHLCLAENLHSFSCEQTDIPRACSHQPYFSYCHLFVSSFHFLRQCDAQLTGFLNIALYLILMPLTGSLMVIKPRYLYLILPAHCVCCHRRGTPAVQPADERSLRLRLRRGSPVLTSFQAGVILPCPALHG